MRYYQPVSNSQSSTNINEYIARCPGTCPGTCIRCRETGLACRKLQVENGKLDTNQPKFTLSAVSKRYGANLVGVNVQAFNKAWQQDPDFYIGMNGTGSIGNRYDRFGEFLSTGATIEASEVEVNTMGQVFFDNGRHRFAYLRDKGLTTIPVAMTPESIKNAKQFGYLA